MQGNAGHLGPMLKSLSIPIDALRAGSRDGPDSGPLGVSGQRSRTSPPALALEAVLSMHTAWCALGTDRNTNWADWSTFIATANDRDRP